MIQNSVSQKIKKAREINFIISGFIDTGLMFAGVVISQIHTHIKYVNSILKCFFNICPFRIPPEGEK